jgi:hypothetical protein
LPLKFPLSGLDDVSLRQITIATFNTGGNEFDVAAAFMTQRIKAELEAWLVLGKPPGLIDIRKELPKLSVGLSRTGNFARYFRIHMDTLGEINALKQRIDETNLN